MKLNSLIICILFLSFYYETFPQIIKDTTSVMNSNDAQSIIKAVEDFQTAWNNADAKAAAQFYTDDAVRVGAFGDIQHGKAEIESAYDRLLHQTMTGAKLNQERGNVRMLTPDLAIWEGAIEIKPANSEALQKGYVVQVMKKVNDKWMVLEAHPKLFPQPK